MKERIKTFTAFLRGINVGGNNPIKMDALRSALEDAGFADVKTILASGNVVFDAAPASESAIADRIEERLKAAFGKTIGVVVRTIDDLQKLVDGNPFKGITPDSKTKLYVTFLPQKTVKKPPAPETSGFTIVRNTGREICSYIELTPGVQSTNLMSWLDKTFGKTVTTRNWNTIAKILKATSR